MSVFAALAKNRCNAKDTSGQLDQDSTDELHDVIEAMSGQRFCPKCKRFKPRWGSDVRLNTAAWGNICHECFFKTIMGYLERDGHK